MAEGAAGGGEPPSAWRTGRRRWVVVAAATAGGGGPGEARRRAATVANAYARSYVEFRRKQSVDSVVTAGREVQLQVAGIQRQVDAIDREVAAAPADQRSQVESDVRARRDALIGQ